MPEGPITFTKTRLAYGWLSNFAAYPIEFNDIVFPTAEHVFQYMRFLSPKWVKGSLEARADALPVMYQIRDTRSPFGAKLIAHDHRESWLVQPHSRSDLENMLAVLRFKAQQHPQLRQALIQTGTRMIIEDCTYRVQREPVEFWGARWGQRREVTSSGHVIQYANGEWKGLNKLGMLWLQVRDECRKGWHVDGGLLDPGPRPQPGSFW